ncbi:MAG: autotransporter domain-containing protein, partial [Candidatus Omnitrophica bacterium]|nr:autotransporter domain-containing protein [Candidatus Omnitrophota bacterium]
MKFLKFSILAIFALLFFIDPSMALAESYDDAVTAAQNNIDSNTDFIPGLAVSGNKAIITIQGSPGSENSAFGLQYDNSYGDGKNYLISRTDTNISNYFTSSTQVLIGVGDYTTYGTAGVDASWMTVGNDTTNFLDTNGATAANVKTLLERGLGMNTNVAKKHQAIVEYAVLPDNDNLMRPGRKSDIKSYSTTSSDYTYAATFDATNTTKPSDMGKTTYDNLNTYLTSWQTSALGEWHPPVVAPTGPFPWTELGYTYFWDSGGTDLKHVQGMTEFIILGGTAVKLYGIYSVQSYLYTKNKNGAFSTATDAQYGNGFGSFNVTGDCDTIWAGNAFQSRASTDASNPNQIILASSKTISNGQGILVWSPNYKITNYGTITGTTLNKLYYDGTNTGLSGTSDIAILFKGDTSFGSIPGGKNQLVNSGEISSPGIAVQADAGDTVITNNSTGTISGTTYAVYLKSGTNSITNSGSITKAGAGTMAIQLDGGTTTITNQGSGAITGGLTLKNSSTAVLDVGANELVITDGVYTQGSGATLKLTATSATTFGKVTTTSGTTSVAADSKANVKIAGYIPNNTTFSNVVSGTGSGSINVPATITATSPIFTFAGTKGSGDHLSLTATRAKSYNSFATNANATAAGTVLNAVATNGTASGDITAVLGALDSLTSGDQIDHALNDLAPDVSNSAPQVNYETQGKFINTAVDHINGVFEGSFASTGVLDPAIWARVFDSYLHQDPRGTSNGYNANVWGLIGGYDTQVRNDLAFGVSVGYARDEVRTKDFSAQSGIDSYQLGLYGSFKRKSYYIDGVYSFAYNRYDSSRKITFATLERTPISKYGGQQYSLYFEGGRSFEHKKFEITPLLSMQYARLNI